MDCGNLMCSQPGNFTFPHAILILPSWEGQLFSIVFYLSSSAGLEFEIAEPCGNRCFVKTLTIWGQPCNTRLCTNIYMIMKALGSLSWFKVQWTLFTLKQSGSLPQLVWQRGFPPCDLDPWSCDHLRPCDCWFGWSSWYLRRRQWRQR